MPVISQGKRRGMRGICKSFFPAVLHGACKMPVPIYVVMRSISIKGTGNQSDDRPMYPLFYPRQLPFRPPAISKLRIPVKHNCHAVRMQAGFIKSQFSIRSCIMQALHFHIGSAERKTGRAQIPDIHLILPNIRQIKVTGGFPLMPVFLPETLSAFHTEIPFQIYKGSVLPFRTCFPADRKSVV